MKYVIHIIVYSLRFRSTNIFGMYVHTTQKSSLKEIGVCFTDVNLICSVYGVTTHWYIRATSGIKSIYIELYRIGICSLGVGGWGLDDSEKVEGFVPDVYGVC